MAGDAVGDPIRVPIRAPEEAAALAAKLRTPEAALTSIGAVVVAQGHEAFERQILGDVIWPERYPKQKDPFINIAPVVQKAGEGRAPTADDFRRRPALGGVQSELAQSLAFDVRGNAVEIGSNRSDLHPELFQFGGQGRIPVTDTTRKTLASWLFTGKGKGEVKTPKGGTSWSKSKLSKAKVAAAPGTTRADYARKLHFVFEKGRTELVQGAHARPFIGFTDKTLAEVENELAVWLGGTRAA